MSIKDKITKGKWSANYSYGTATRLYVDNRKILADFFTFSEGIPDEEAEANTLCASVIPEMLDILERLAQLQDWKDTMGFEKHADNLIEDAIDLLNNLNQ